MRTTDQRTNIMSNPFKGIIYINHIFQNVNCLLISSSSRKMEMKTVYADRSDSESDGEDDSGFELVNDPKEKQSASTKVKSLFKKSKK